MSGPSQVGGARLFGANIDVIGKTYVRGFRGFEVYLSGDHFSFTSHSSLITSHLPLITDSCTLITIASHRIDSHACSSWNHGDGDSSVTQFRVMRQYLFTDYRPPGST
jgi:hypothetical protein